jgi:hypothetical protein
VPYPATIAVTVGTAMLVAGGQMLMRHGIALQVRRSRGRG